MKNLVLLILLLCFISFVEAQHIIKEPAVAEQSHQDLNIIQICLYKDSSVIYLSVENKMTQGGWFCADKNIYIENPKDHKHLKIIKTMGIPTCPSAYNFTREGEKLNFSLVFPQIPSETKLLNLIEDCDKSCFRFNGIILDEKLNNDIKLYNRGIELYAANNTPEAINCFMKVVEAIPEFPTHVYGYSYFNLIRIYATKGDKETSRRWLYQLEKSTLPDKQYFIGILKKEGVIGE